MNLEKPPLENNISETENYGKNVEMVVDLIRHGEKNKKGQLTDKGKTESEQYRDTLEKEWPESAGIKIYHTDYERTRETGEIVGDKSKFVARERKEALSLTDRMSEEFTAELIKKVNKETGDESKVVQAVIDTGHSRPDKNTASSAEISAGVASQMLKLSKMTERFKEDSKVNVVLVSHSGVIENFIVDVLKDERKEFINKAGGQLKPLEGLRLVIRRKNKETVDIEISFRGRSISISETDLEAISKQTR